MKKVLQEQLLQREMTRKQFLQLLMVAVLSILGINNLLSLLTGFTSKTALIDDKTERHGFGSSKFGA